MYHPSHKCWSSWGVNSYSKYGDSWDFVSKDLIKGFNRTILRSGWEVKMSIGVKVNKICITFWQFMLQSTFHWSNMTQINHSHAINKNFIEKNTLCWWHGERWFNYKRLLIFYLWNWQKTTKLCEHMPEVLSHWFSYYCPVIINI